MNKLQAKWQRLNPDYSFNFWGRLIVTVLVLGLLIGSWFVFGFNTFAAESKPEEVLVTILLTFVLLALIGVMVVIVAFGVTFFFSWLIRGNDTFVDTIAEFLADSFMLLKKIILFITTK